MNHRDDLDRTLRMECAGRILELSETPAIMGIVNLTPDSFFDRSRFGTPTTAHDLDQALQRALDMVTAGADIIDVGGESTRPGAEPVSADEEITRTVPFIERLRTRTEAFISIDTWKSEVAAAALEAGADIVNDISGFTFDDHMPEVCGKHRCGVVLMHTKVAPERMRWSHDTQDKGRDIVQEVLESLARSIGLARSHGVTAIATDPGIGFGKSVEENFRLLDRLDDLHDLGYPVLAGVSRKSFLGHAIRQNDDRIPAPGERLEATTCANTIALMHGADILRVHDVGAAVQVRAVVRATRRSRGLQG